MIGPSLDKKHDERVFAIVGFRHHSNALQQNDRFEQLNIDIMELINFLLETSWNGNAISVMGWTTQSQTATFTCAVVQLIG